MNIVKKVIALITVAIIVIRTFTFSVFATFAAPAVAETLAELLAALLSSTCGYTQSQLDGMSVNDMKNAFSDNLSSGNIDLKKSYDISFPADSSFMSVETSIIDFFTNPKYVASDKVMHSLLNTALKTWFKEQFSSYEVLSDSLVGVSSVNMRGYGAAYRILDPRYNYYYTYYCDYICVNPDGYLTLYFSSGPILYEVYRVSDGYYYPDQYYYTHPSTTDLNIYNWIVSGVPYYWLYGDVRYTDGSVYPTDDEIVIPDEDTVIGELPDGTQVTIGDLLGTDGTIDGEQVIPNWDIFDPSVLVDLINDLLDKYQEASTKTDSSDLTDSVVDSVEDSISDSLSELDLAGLENLVLPTSIVHVFPFCLPFDFVQGMYLFEAEPEIPHFEAELDFTNLMGYNLGKHTIVIDLKEFETLAKISRWISMILFVYTLIFLTGKIVKGAGA